jgi:hypothetical protein
VAESPKHEVLGNFAVRERRRSGARISRVRSTGEFWRPTTRRAKRVRFFGRIAPRGEARGKSPWPK